MCETKWRNRTCDICGIGSHAHVSVKMDLPDDDSDYPYTETALCKSCFDEFGFEPAIENNRQAREDME